MRTYLIGRSFLCLCLGTGTVAPAFAASDAPDGMYACWQFSSPIPSLNFTLSGDTYTDSEGEAGKIRGSDTVITFVGAALDGTRAKYRKDAPPTFSLLGQRGEELSSCQLTQ